MSPVWFFSSPAARLGSVEHRLTDISLLFFIPSHSSYSSSSHIVTNIHSLTSIVIVILSILPCPAGYTVITTIPSLTFFSHHRHFSLPPTCCYKYKRVHECCRVAYGSDGAFGCCCLLVICCLHTYYSCRVFSCLLASCHVSIITNDRT